MRFFIILAILGGCSMNSDGLDTMLPPVPAVDASDGGPPDALVDAGTSDAQLPPPRRPLGAGCTEDSQCASAICDRADTAATTGQCCDGRVDACNNCVGGYLVPLQDGTQCGPGLCDGVAPYFGQGGRTATNFVCHGGSCVSQSTDCQQRWCYMASGQACLPGKGNVCTGPGGSSSTWCACATGLTPDSSCP